MLLPGSLCQQWTWLCHCQGHPVSSGRGCGCAVIDLKSENKDFDICIAGDLND